MGVPDFEGGWASQPSIWRQACLRQAAFAMSLSHVVNESKREAVCPLAVSEVWAHWDEGGPSPKGFKLAVEWGRRPAAAISEMGRPPMGRAEEIAKLADSRGFWSSCAHERDEGMLARPFPGMDALLARESERFALLYRDSRVEPLAGARARGHLLWRARRAALASRAGEVGDLLRSVGAAMAYAALPMPSGRLTLGELRDARERGMGLAIEALMSCASHRGRADSAMEYDFACREAGEAAVEMGNAVKSMAYLQGFFTALSESPWWAGVAGGGEQEAFFCLLCRIETKWGESLDAVERCRRG